MRVCMGGGGTSACAHANGHPPARAQVLYEEEQVLPDGRVRRRNIPISEKVGARPMSFSLQIAGLVRVWCGLRVS
jgi:hypothetical protein